MGNITTNTNVLYVMFESAHFNLTFTAFFFLFVLYHGHISLEYTADDVLSFLKRLTERWTRREEEGWEGRGGGGQGGNVTRNDRNEVGEGEEEG